MSQNSKQSPSPAKISVIKNQATKKKGCGCGKKKR
jgi:hypothetical protein